MISLEHSSASAALVSQVRGQEEELGVGVSSLEVGEAAGGCWVVRMSKQNEDPPYTHQ